MPMGLFDKRMNTEQGGNKTGGTPTDQSYLYRHYA
jgi:hypothetical protein